MRSLALACALIVASINCAVGGASADDTALRRMIGQMIIVGFDGRSAHEPWPKLVIEQLRRGEIGGVLYLSRNIESAAQVKNLNRALIEAAGALPPLITVDQEGGKIQRLRESVGVPSLPTAQQLGRTGIAGAGRRFAAVAKALKDLGFNTNFAPVVDLLVEPRNPIIARLGRSYGADPIIVTRFAAAFVEAHRAVGVATSLKHFPGHGSSLDDSHNELPDISRTWAPEEFAPYRALISRGLADMVMIGHLALDPGRAAGAAPLPATLSWPIVTGMLRGGLGYEGVIVGDDLEMSAIADGRSPEEMLIGMIWAGVDLAIIANLKMPRPRLPAKLIDAVAAEAKRDDQFRKRVSIAYARIVALKLRLFKDSGRR